MFRRSGGILNFMQFSILSIKKTYNCKHYNYGVVTTLTIFGTKTIYVFYLVLNFLRFFIKTSQSPRFLAEKGLHVQFLYTINKLFKDYNKGSCCSSFIIKSRMVYDHCNIGGSYPVSLSVVHNSQLICKTIQYIIIHNIILIQYA